MGIAPVARCGLRPAPYDSTMIAVPDDAARRRIRAVGVPVAPALLAAVLATWTSVRTPMWRDEYATAMYSSLDPAGLLAATTHLDAVIAPYYFVMQALSPLTGSGTGMRFLSIAAFAAMTAFVAIIARRWWGDLAGLVAGTALAVSTLALGAAALARPYALSMLFVTLAVLAVDTAVRRHTVWSWAMYALAAGAAVVLQPFASLSIAITGLLAVGRPRRAVGWWLLASLPAGVATLAVLLVGAGHAAQLSWLMPVTPRSAIQNLALAVGLSPERQVIFDAIVVLVLVVAISLAVSVLRREEARGLVFSAALTFAPPLSLFLISLAVTPVLSGRYLSYSAIGAALCLGGIIHAALSSNRRPAAVAAGVLGAVLVALSLGLGGVRLAGPPFMGDDMPEMASRIASSAQPGDILVVTQRYEQGGLAYGLAVVTDDERFRAEILAGIPDGPRPVLDVREIVSTDPLRSVPYSEAEQVGQDRDLWLVSIWPPEEADPGTVDPGVARCLRDLDPEDHVLISGVRLYRTPCSASG